MFNNCKICDNYKFDEVEICPKCQEKKRNIMNTLRFGDKIKVNGIVGIVYRINNRCYFSTNDNKEGINAMISSGEKRTGYKYNYITNSLFVKNNNVIFLEEGEGYDKKSIYNQGQEIL